MNTIQIIMEQLNNAVQPVARVLHHGSHCKTLAIGFKAGMTLKDHQTNVAATLFVARGEVIYKQENQEFTLSACSYMAIPVNTVHAVFAVTDSLCLLIQG